jgi:hypothetical protein
MRTQSPADLIFGDTPDNRRASVIALSGVNVIATFQLLWWCLNRRPGPATYRSPTLSWKSSVKARSSLLRGRRNDEWEAIAFIAAELPVRVGDLIHRNIEENGR